MIRVGELVVEVLPSGRDYRLVRPLEVHLHGQDYAVPQGFVTDFASVPRGLWNLFPPAGPWCPAAVWHDWRYQTGAVSRAQADREFREIMAHLGVASWVRWAMWAGVRLGGWASWQRYRRGS